LFGVFLPWESYFEVSFNVKVILLDPKNEKKKYRDIAPLTKAMEE